MFISLQLSKLLVRAMPGSSTVLLKNILRQQCFSPFCRVIFNQHAVLADKYPVHLILSATVICSDLTLSQLYSLVNLLRTY